MSGPKDQTPINLALKVASLLREDWQQVWLRQSVPFMASAQWGAGLLDLRAGGPLPEELDWLVDSITESMDAIGIDRVGVFIMADWDRFDAGQVERTLLRLSERFPEAKVEALPLHEEGSLNVELVIAIGGR